MLNKASLTASQIFDVLDDAAAHGVFMVVLSGGDPVLHPHFSKILKAIESRSMLALPGISGNVLDATHLAGLKDANVPCVQVSLDAALPDAHDRFRGAGHFDAIRRNVTKLREVGIHVNLAICVRRENRDQLLPLIGLARDWGIYRIKIAFYEVFGAVAGAACLAPHERVECIRDVASLAQHDDLPPSLISIPGYDTATGAPFRDTQRPTIPISISASGIVAVGDGGPVIGHLHDTRPVSQQYSEWKCGQLEHQLDILIAQRGADFRVKSIIDVTTPLPGNALVFHEEEGATIIANGNLPWALNRFAKLHELGHLATQTLRPSPTQTPSNRTSERRANLWALDQLRPWLTPSTLNDYAHAAADSEHAMYQRVAQRLAHDLFVENLRTPFHPHK